LSPLADRGGQAGAATVLARIVSWAEPYSVLPLRIVVGLIFIGHGGHTLFVAGFSGGERVASQLGLRPPDVWGVLIILVEFIGGLGILLGILTRWAALLLTIEVVLTILRVQGLRGLLTSPASYQSSLMLAAACLTLLVTGAKKPAIDPTS
jgi:putative oxidoreductase